MERWTYNSDELFEEIPGDPDNVIMKFPPELLEKIGWKEGDVLNIVVKDGSMVISKV